MNEDEGVVSWQDVSLALLMRWPAQKWGRDQLAGYITELEVDGLTPERAMVGLRASRSGFVPSVGKVRELYWEATPIRTADLYRLDVQRQARVDAEREQWLLGEATTDEAAEDRS